jgi:hypothetical protein
MLNPVFGPYALNQPHHPLIYLFDRKRQDGRTTNFPKRQPDFQNRR